MGAARSLFRIVAFCSGGRDPTRRLGPRLRERRFPDSNAKAVLQSSITSFAVSDCKNLTRYHDHSLTFGWPQPDLLISPELIASGTITPPGNECFRFLCFEANRQKHSLGTRFGKVTVPRCCVACLPGGGPRGTAQAGCTPRRPYSHRAVDEIF